MKNTDYVSVISITSIFSILFLNAFAFNLTASPTLLMLMGLASFGYTLILLGIGSTNKNWRTRIYTCIGLVLILLSLLSAMYTPHSSGLFF